VTGQSIDQLIFHPGTVINRFSIPEQNGQSIDRLQKRVFQQSRATNRFTMAINRLMKCNLGFLMKL
jgi:hypothetical protein